VPHSQEKSIVPAVAAAELNRTPGAVVSMADPPYVLPLMRMAISPAMAPEH
jgi:hypothetical protein